MSRTCRCIVLGIFALCATVASAQTAQGIIQGTVQDPTGARIPGASIQLTGRAQGVSRTTVAGGEGRFVIPSILPGEYELLVTAKGFQRFRQSPIKVDVQQTVSLDVQLSVGDVTNTIEVTTDAAPIDATTSSVATTLGNKAVTDLPMIGRSVIGLANLLPGVLPGQGSAGGTGQYGPAIGGGRSGSGDIRVDGASMMLSDANNAILIMGGSLPNIDAVEEITVVVNTLAAEYGRSGSGAILLASKSGTNKLHGSIYDFFRNNRLNANNFFNNRAGAPIGIFNSNQFGFSLGGPIWVPRSYNGRNRTFFFVDYQGLRAKSPSDFTGTVPITAWKNGDFADLRTSNGAAITVFDPLTVTDTPDAQGNFFRSPFAGNRIPASRFDRVGRNLLNFYPEPNQAPVNTNTQVNNYFRGLIAPAREDNFTTRIDHNFTSAWRSFWRFTKGLQIEDPPNVFGTAGTPLGRGYRRVTRHNVAWNNVYTLNSTTFFDVTYGLSRFSNNLNPPSAGFDLTTLGFPGYVREQAQRDIYSRFPNVSILGLTTMGTINGAGLRFTPTNHNAAVSMTKVTSKHTVKAGVEYRKFFLNFWQESAPAGTFSFGQNWTQRNPIRNVATEGFGVASLLLGLGSGSQTNNISQALASSYWGAFLQDDYRLTSKLTLNIGLRYELDVPKTERYNRMSYWDAGAVSPIEGRVPGVRNLRGAMNFVSAENRQQFSADKNNWSPRIGFAYQFNPATVLRGGYAFMYAPSIAQATYGNGGFQGFRCTTAMITTIDNRTPVNYLRDPFPTGYCANDGPRPGPFSGTATSLGQTIQESWFPETVNPAVQQASLNLQRQLPGQMVVEAGYIGNKGNHLIDGGVTAFNQLTPDYFQLGNSLNDPLPNPFRGIIVDPTSSLALPTVARRQLLSAYPQYTGVNSLARPTGNSLYHSLLLRVQKRFNSGFGFLISYTAGKEITDSGWGNTLASINGATGRQNVYDRKSDRAIGTDDVSSRLVVSFNVELPIGRGKRLLSAMPRGADLLLGGWQLNGIITLQSGLPVVLFSAVNQTGIGSVAQRPNNNGRSANLSGQHGSRDEQIQRWFDGSVFSVAAPFTFGNAPTVLPDVRNPGIRNFDLSVFKSFAVLSENRLSAQLRLEASNAFNTTQLGRPGSTVGAPALGIIDRVGVGPRSVQLALKLIF